MTVTYYNSNSNRENLVLVETHKRRVSIMSVINELIRTCLLYTSDAADEL